MYYINHHIFHKLTLKIINLFFKIIIRFKFIELKNNNNYFNEE